MQRFGLVVVDANPSTASTTSLELPDEFPSVEEALKISAGAFEALQHGGLSEAEAQCLQTTANLTRIYKEMLTRKDIRSIWRF
jgi:hypothetical protein